MQSSVLPCLRTRSASDILSLAAAMLLGCCGVALDAGRLHADDGPPAAAPLAEDKVAAPLAEDKVAAPLPNDEKVVYLQSGGSVHGRVKAIQSGKQTLYVVDAGNGVQMSMTRGEVAHVEGNDDLLRQYRSRLAQTPEQADAHWELARWCKMNNLLPQYERQVRHVVSLDPDHGTARQAMGQTQYEGRWVNFDQLQRSRELVHYHGKWILGKDLEMLRAAEDIEVQQKQWAATIKRLRSRLGKGGKASDEAMAQLTAINDPLAASTLAELLRKADDPDPLRMLWVQLLSQWEIPVAADAMIYSSLFDPAASVRDACFDWLEQHAKQRAVNTYITLLTDADNRKVKLGGRALTKLSDPSAALPLVDALITKHKFKLSSGGGPGKMTTSFDSSGSSGAGGMTMGGKDQVIERSIQNPTVLSALMTAVPEVDFQYDAARWRAHIASQSSGVSFDLRRDP